MEGTIDYKVVGLIARHMGRENEGEEDTDVRDS